MRRIAFALLTAFVFVSFGFVTSPARAGDYGYYGDGYSGDAYYTGYRHHRTYDHYYSRRYSDDGYYRRHRHRSVWYTSSCCYRKVVRHTRSVRYVRTYDDYGYYRRPYRHVYYSDYYTRPYRYYSYRRPYYHHTYSGYYGWRHHYRPYRHYYTSAYLYRPYRHYYAGYNTVGYLGYGECRRIPLADGRGGWVWSRRAGCF